MKNKGPVISEKNHTTYIEAIEIDLSSATNEENHVRKIKKRRKI